MSHILNMTQHSFQLSPADKASLIRLLRKGSLETKVFKRATALLELDRGQPLTGIAATLNVTYKTVGNWRDSYTAQGLAMLSDKPRSGRPLKIDGVQRAHITALACSTPPEGHSRWSLRLLADKAVELDLVEAISHDHVGTILKKTNSSRT
jgi:putative transposase